MWRYGADLPSRADTALTQTLKAIILARISKRLVDAAASSAKRYVVWDDAVKGFGILILPSGVKSYIFNYRNSYNQERRITIGKHGGGLTPDAARGIAEAHERDVAMGGDPLAKKRSATLALTVGDLLDDYISSKAFANKAASTQSIDRGRIDHHLRPTLGALPLPTLSANQVERAHSAIVAGKTAVTKASGRKRGRIRATGGAGTARMSIRLLRSILAWGAKRGTVAADVASVAGYVAIGRDGRRTAILEDDRAYARMFKAIERLSDPSLLNEGERLLRPAVADAIRLIALTGARRGEIANLRWADVDLAKGLITLPANAHKTGRKTGESRVIGLPRLAVEIIERQPTRKAEEVVFLPSRGGQRIDLGKPWTLVCRAAELPKGFGLHGLRHSLASHMAMQGSEASEIMTALGHRDISTSQRYVHWASDQRQALAEKAAAGISAVLRGDQALPRSRPIDARRLPET